MWTLPALDGADPAERLTKIRCAHAQIDSDRENLFNRWLTYAMTLALPDIYSTPKQLLLLREPQTSASVQAAVQAEWTRRGFEEATAK
uniref:Uncharacterized protein n=1 Tax=Kwoniella pini CBS 10737 TaxID=1296096 RepID=A0A1B9I8D8_9TREE|nr:uncharacterized protein I206_02480 [Kwoniella pini CBS 10737]OCF51764.1 hypothetical protein I206_02480 [Kwoniella pini CBS 10737]